MAQIEKYTLRQAKHIIAHVERTGATHSNKRIDMTRTDQNYALWPLNDPDRLVLGTGVEGQSSGRYAWVRLKKRLSEVSCLRRGDVNVMCDWCLHLGVDVPPGFESKLAFFKAAVHLLSSLYGPENVLYAWVHEDEVHSHLHFGFVPIIKKKLKLRKNASAATRAEYEQAISEGRDVIERVDANALINRRHLQGWHPSFRKAMTSLLGYDPGVYTGVTQYLGGNTTVRELKQTPPDWREQRNAKVEAFHAARRGEAVDLDTKIAASSPLSLADKVKAAMERSGHKKERGN